jgi:HK97 family phage portal protein
MSILGRLFGSKPETRERAAPQMSTQFFTGHNHGNASPHLSQNLTGVLACTNVVATGIASLPARVYQQTPAGRFEAPNHPVARLIRAPNPYQTWQDLVEWVTAETLLSGNGLCELQTDGAGRPTALLPIPWRHVLPSLLPNGRMVYDIIGYQAPWGSIGGMRRLFADEVFHLKDRGDEPFVGRSRLSRAPRVITNALDEQTFIGSVWKNQATPSGAFKTEASLSDANFERVKSQVRENYAGVNNAGRIMMLDNGLSFQPFSISPEDAELLDSRKFTTEEFCRLFQVPPPLVQDYSNNTFTNSQSAALWFAQFSLQPWVSKIESEFARSVFGSSSGSYCLEIDMTGLTRGDFAARWASYAIAVPQNILGTDEIREIEGFPPRVKQ